MARLMKRALVLLLPFGAYGRVLDVSPGGNCTDASSKSLSWVIRNLTVDTDTKFDFGPGTVGKVSFSIHNTANGVDVHCLQGEGPTTRTPNRYVVGNEVWYSCNVYCKGARNALDEKDPPLETSFHIDVNKKSLSVRQKWACGNWNSSKAYVEIPARSGQFRVILRKANRELIQYSLDYTATGTATISNLTCSSISKGLPGRVSCAPLDSITFKPSQVSVSNGTAAASANSSSGVDNDPYADTGSPSVNPFVPTFYPPPGIASNTAGCSARSKSPMFHVSDFYWSTAGGSVYFTLNNSALDYAQLCVLGEFTVGSPTVSPSADAKQPQAAWFNCTRFDPMHVDYPANSIYTSVLYGGPENILGINQTWYCDDDTTNQPTIYSVYGETNFALKCNETRSCLAPGHYDYDRRPTKVVYDSCTADNLTIVPAHIDSYHVSKEQAVDRFKPRGYNCTDKSLSAVGHQAWEITTFTLNRTYESNGPTGVGMSGTNSTASPGSYTDYLEFWYNNTATDNDWPRNNGWRQCLSISDDSEGYLTGKKKVMCMLSFEPFRLGFQFDKNSSTLTLTQDWTCDGKDQWHNNFFTATGGGKIPLNCHQVGENTRCVSPTAVTIPISNVTSTLNSAEPTPTYT